ncbi:MAG: hypothetical protein RBS56_05380 [Candidatus Gracilibacteria bacterium]|jgi:Zn-dependent M16 (insulinase) family peptidase|nr:hypothetical protein [Candidatus Gracilibacteria bacterium]
MHEISEIKFEALRVFLQTYKHFTSLSDEEKQKYLEKIVLMTEDDQKKVYDFLFEENEKEKVRMLKALNEKLAELSKVLKKIKVKEGEMAEKAKEDQALSDLENQLNQN